MDKKKRLLQYIKPEVKRLVVICIFVLLFVASHVSQPFLVGKAIDAATSLNKDGLIMYVIICGVLALVGVFSGYIFENEVGKLTQSIIKNVRDDVYKKINSIPVGTLYKMSKGDLVQREIADIENVSNGIFAVLKSLVEGVLTVAVTIVMMFLVNWILAICVIVLTPVSLFVSKFVAKFSHKYFRRRAQLQSNLNSISLEAIDNIELVQSLNNETNIEENYKTHESELRKDSVVALFSASWVNPSTRLVNNIIYALIGVFSIVILITGCFDGIGASITIGGVSSFLAYTIQYTKPFNEITNVLAEFETAKFSFDRINNFLNSENDIVTGNEEIHDIEKIEFKNMDFSYNPEVKLIENFNQTILKGQKVAIVGPTGAGKSTLINVLLNFYQPTNGDIYFNGVPQDNLNQKQLLSNFAMVLQETWIFSGTVKENIAYAKPDASDEEIKEACRISHADSFIKTLPYGLDTKVSSKEGLSEGEKQMISIARAALTNPDIVILDEATSNIDTRSEMLITDSFDKMMKGKTSIVIAHRLSTIRTADIIIVLKDGAVIEQGDHDSLMKSKGFYYKMYSSQFSN